MGAVQTAPLIVPTVGSCPCPGDRNLNSGFAPTGAPTTQRGSAGLEGAQCSMPGCSACIRGAERGSVRECRMSFKLLVRGSRPRRPTKVQVGVGVRDVCSANYPSAPTLTRETTADVPLAALCSSDAAAGGLVLMDRQGRTVWKVRVYVCRDSVTLGQRDMTRMVHAGPRARAGKPLREVTKVEHDLVAEATRGGGALGRPPGRSVTCWSGTSSIWS
jgi:hypothetical protein